MRMMLILLHSVSTLGKNRPQIKVKRDDRAMSGEMM